MTSPRQLPLDLPSATAQGREDFLVSPSNEAAYALVEGWRSWPDRRALVVGPAGAGKSHLAAIWAAEAGAVIVEAAALGVDMVPELLGAGGLAIENADDPAVDEAALFHCINLARETGAVLLLTARSVPSLWPLQTADLASRLRTFSVARIEPPDEALLRSVLVKLFVDRQLVVDTSVVDHLARHLDRSFDAVRRAVAALDREALARGRRITRVMASEVLVDATSSEEPDT